MEKKQTMIQREKNGQFRKGSGGRPKGSRNKQTDSIRQYFLDFIECNSVDLQDAYNDLESKDKIKFISEMTRFLLPSVKSVEVNSTIDELTAEQFEEVVERIKEELTQN